MKKIAVVIVSVICALFVSCSPALDNSVTVKNIAQETVYLNIFGKIITVKSGGTQTIKNIQKGSYGYATTYTIPAAASSSSVEGNAEGNLMLDAGTRISILYASRLQASQSGGGAANQLSYVLVVSVSSNDKVSSGGSTTGP